MKLWITFIGPVILLFMGATIEGGQSALAHFLYLGAIVYAIAFSSSDAS